MAENETTGQEGTEAASSDAQPTFDPSSQTVEVSGRTMTIADLQKSYTESEKTMRQSQQDLHTANAKLEGLSWAPDILQRYNNEADFKSGFDALLEGQGRQAPQEFHPQYQEIQQLKQEQLLQRWERQFDQLRQDGNDLSKDQEMQILQELNSQRFQDAESAYKTLFWNEALAKARDQSASQTMEQHSENTSAYSQPAKGTAKSSAPPDVSKMSSEEWDSAMLKRIDNDMFKNE